MAKWEDNPIVNKLFEDVAKRIEKDLKEVVEQVGLTDTHELVQSIRAGSVMVGDKVISSKVFFSSLLRIKDVKSMHYMTIPPLGPLLDWVERVGVSKFAYVPGYPNGVRKGTEIDKIYRIASAVQYNLKARPNVKRGYRGIYNDVVFKKIIPEFMDALRASSTVWAATNINESFGFDTYVPIPSDALNASRIQAAWNARDTKLARKFAQK